MSTERIKTQRLSNYTLDGPGRMRRKIAQLSDFTTCDSVSLSGTFKPMIYRILPANKVASCRSQRVNIA